MESPTSLDNATISRVGFSEHNFTNSLASGVQIPSEPNIAPRLNSATPLHFIVIHHNDLSSSADANRLGDEWPRMGAVSGHASLKVSASKLDGNDTSGPNNDRSFNQQSRTKASEGERLIAFPVELHQRECDTVHRNK